MRLHSLLYIPLLRLCALFTTLQGFWWFGLSFSCYSSGQSFLFSVRGLPRICQREGKQLNISNVECCRTDFCNMDLKPTLSTFYVSGMDLITYWQKEHKASFPDCTSSAYPKIKPGSNRYFVSLRGTIMSGKLPSTPTKSIQSIYTVIPTSTQTNQCNTNTPRVH